MLARFRSLGISNFAFFFRTPSDLNTNAGDVGRNFECLSISPVSAASEDVVDAQPP